MQIETALGMLKVFDMPYVLLNEKRDFSWDGKNLAVYQSDKPSGIIHELGHWLIAPNSRRKKIDFGLVSGFRSVECSIAVVKDPHPEEIKVCLFEIGVAFMYGCDWRDVALHDCFNFDHKLTWDRFLELDDAPKHVEALRKKRFFVGNIPTIVPRLLELGPQIREAREEWHQFLKS